MENDSDVVRVRFRHFLQPAVVHAPFTVSGQESQPFNLSESAERFTEFSLQVIDSLLRHKADHLEGEDRLVTLVPFLKHRLTPVLELPVPVDLQESRPRLLTKADQLKHLLEVPVPAIAHAPSDRFGLRYPHQARVPEPEQVRAFNHKDRTSARIIGMNQGVYKRFTQRLMNRGLLDSLVALQLKRHLQVARKPLHGNAVEIVQIPRPRTVECNPINPAGFGRLPLLVVYDIGGNGVEDRPEFPEHQQPCERETLLSRLSIPCPPTDLPEEFLVVALIERVIRLAIGKLLPVDPK